MMLFKEQTVECILIQIGTHVAFDDRMTSDGCRTSTLGNGAILGGHSPVHEIPTRTGRLQCFFSNINTTHCVNDVRIHSALTMTRYQCQNY